MIRAMLSCDKFATLPTRYVDSHQRVLPHSAHVDFAIPSGLPDPSTGDIEMFDSCAGAGALTCFHRAIPAAMLAELCDLEPQPRRSQMDAADVGSSRTNTAFHFHSQCSQCVVPG